MTNEVFKGKAKQHQIDFRCDPEIGIPASPGKFPYRDVIHPKTKEVKSVPVEHSLLKNDVRDQKGFRIFYSGFREEISKAVDIFKNPCSDNDPIVTNLLRSEHIPFNVFFPMKWDLEGTARLFNELLGKELIETIKSMEDIQIEYNPGTLKDGTAFDVFIKYISPEGKAGGIGIEVKYTEKEYALKKRDKSGVFTKEYSETHDPITGDIRLAENYMVPSKDSGWFKPEFIGHIPASRINRKTKHVVMNHYRQIWRNHLLGASMLLEPSEKPEHLDEFISLTIYPEGNGHFSDKLWNEYEDMLTEKGKASFMHKTYEELFPLMGKHLRGIAGVDDWIDYLNRRYIVTD